MKTRKYIYLILGITLIVINSFVSYSMYKNFEYVTSEDIYGVAYMIGNQALTIIGLFLLFGAYRVQKKINRKKREALENAF